jgi:membrane-associated phospholipid phosphatase
VIEAIHALDTQLIYAVQAVGPAWFHVAWLLSYIIGSLEWLAPTMVLALFFIGKKRVALELLCIFAISRLFVFVTKALIDAPRPYWIDDAVIAYASHASSGMPSGHAFMAVVIFGWLWFRHPRSLILSLGAGTIIFLIGLSRVYLGVHYPSQVLVGWACGGLFLWLFWWLDKKYFRPKNSYIKRGRK